MVQCGTMWCNVVWYRLPSCCRCGLLRPCVFFFVWDWPVISIMRLTNRVSSCRTSPYLTLPYLVLSPSNSLDVLLYCTYAPAVDETQRCSLPRPSILRILRHSEWAALVLYSSARLTAPVFCVSRDSSFGPTGTDLTDRQTDTFRQ